MGAKVSPVQCEEPKRVGCDYQEATITGVHVEVGCISDILVSGTDQ